MAKQFVKAFPDWLSWFYSEMNNSAEKRADIHELIQELDEGSELTEQQVELLKSVLSEYVSLYHICNKSPEKMYGLISLLKPD